MRTIGAHWPLVMAFIATVALLLVFDRVVRQAVQQGALRHVAERERSNAIWRCNALQALQARTECRQRIL